MDLVKELENEARVEQAAAATMEALRSFSSEVRIRALLRCMARAQQDLPSRTHAPSLDSAIKIGDGLTPAMGKTELIVAILKQNPEVTIEEMALTVYSEVSIRAKAKVRSLLDQAKNKGLVQSPSRGRWEAVV